MTVNVLHANIRKSEVGHWMKAEMSLGSFIVQRRGALGMTQPQLAVEIDRPASWISRLENDKLAHMPEPELMELLARALQVTVADLVNAFQSLWREFRFCDMTLESSSGTTGAPVHFQSLWREFRFCDRQFSKRR